MLAALALLVGVTEFQNAVYHLACATGGMACSGDVIVRYWNEEVKPGAEMGARFEEWKSIFERVGARAGLPAPAPFLPNYTSHYPAMAARQRLLAMAFDSRSAAEFARRARSVIPAREARSLESAVDTVERELHGRWKAQRRTALRAPALAAEMARFFEARDVPREIEVHAVPMPGTNTQRGFATTVGRHIIVETWEGDAGAAVVLHEMCHLLYESAPAARRMELLRQFAASNDAAAQALYAHLNEAVASAAQLLLRGDAYRDPYIPALAEATLPLLRDALEKRETLYSGFAADYIRKGREALGEVAGSFGFRLTAAAVLSPSDNAKRRFEDAFHPRFRVDTEAEAALFPDLNVVRLETAAEAAIHREEIDDYDTLRRQRGFVFVRSRGRLGQTLFAIGEDERALMEAIDCLAARRNAALTNGTVLVLGKSGACRTP